MATTRHYWDLFKAARDQIGEIMGLDMTRSPIEVRGGDDASLTAVAALTKALIDKGTLIESDVTTAIGGSVSTDGSFWDPEPFDVPIVGTTGGPWDSFPGEGFESGANGIDVTSSNTVFTGGQYGDTLVAIDATIKFDNSTHSSGALSMKTVTNDTHNRSMLTSMYDSTATWFVRFYFRATVTPSGSGVKIAAAFQDSPTVSTPPPIATFEVYIDSSGIPEMKVNNSGRADLTMPNVCNGNWWRIEAGVYATALTPVCELRVYTGANLHTTTITDSFQGSYDGTRLKTALIGQTQSLISASATWTCWHDDVAFSAVNWVGP